MSFLSNLLRLVVWDSVTKNTENEQSLMNKKIKVFSSKVKVLYVEGVEQ